MRQLVSYIAEYDPEFPLRITAAFPEEIAALERAARRPLPSEYREFLGLMGKGMDWLDMGDADFAIESVTRAHLRGRWETPERFLGIATGSGDPLSDLLLDLESGGLIRLPLCRAVDFSATYENECERLGDSLEQALGMHAFETLEIGGCPFRMSMSQPVPEPVLRQTAAIATSLGFTRLWFSSETAAAFSRDDAAIEMRQPPGSVLRLTLSFSEEADLSAAARRFEIESGLEERKIQPRVEGLPQPR